jgi:ABC-2 type transport system permease protein
MNGLLLVAQREIRTRIRTKSFLISLAITAVLIAALASVPELLGGPDTYDVGVAGKAPAAVEQVTYRTYPDEAAARAAVLAGDVDAAVIDDRTVLADGELDAKLGLLLDGAHREAQIRMAAAGVAPWEIAVAVVLMVVATAAVLLGGARVYERAVLRTGARVKLREAVR